MTGALIGRTPPPATGPHDPAREATGRRVQQGHREGDRDALAIPLLPTSPRESRLSIAYSHPETTNSMTWWR